MSNIIKFGTPDTNTNTFIWNIKNDEDYDISGFEQCSDFFQFCGYCCYLVLRYADDGADDDCFDIILHGYPAPWKKNISCNYSVFMKNVSGQMDVAKSGKMQIEQEMLEFVLFTEYNISLNPALEPTLCFSWSEDRCSKPKLLSKAVQTEPECSTNALEHLTSIADDDSPITRHIGTHEEIERYKFLDTLSNDFESFFENKMNPDCVLIVGETKFAVHRSVLSARSTVFAAMFHHDTTESQIGEVDVKDVDSGPFGDVLYFIYTGKVRGLSPDTAASMYSIADKYALMDIKEKCLEYLLCNLNLDNICDAALLAHTHAEADLENKTVQFVKDRLQELMGTKKWRSFTDTHYKLTNKLLCSALISSLPGKI